LLALACFIGNLLYNSEPDWHTKKLRVKMRFLCIFWPVLAIMVFWGIFIQVSYDDYLDQRAFYDATVEQYASAITMYDSYAEIDVESAAWTDLKYKGYQNNISGLIRNLRNHIINYNVAFVKKNRYHKNPFFSWLVVGMDDDMKILKMKVVSQGS
jgi:hypothetical protein